MRLPIAEPCPEVSNLRGEGSQLHCARCEQTVVDLSVMTAHEARSFLGGLVGRPKPCIRYRMDAAGDILFRSERRAPIGRWSAAVAAGAVAALVPQGAHARHAEPPPGEVTATRDYEGPAEVGAPEDEASGEQTCPLPTEEGVVHGGVPPEDDDFYRGSSREHRRWLRQERRRERQERRARRRAARR